MSLQYMLTHSLTPCFNLIYTGNLVSFALIFLQRAISEPNRQKSLPQSSVLQGTTVTVELTVCYVSHELVGLCLNS